MVAVGEQITKQLELKGIKTIHDTTIHDYPKYEGAYDRSAATVKAILAQYPSIKVVLDIHRDGINDGTTIYQPVAEINGKKAAQVMIVSGCDDGTMGMPNYLQNFRFATSLQQDMESMFPGLTRAVLFKYVKYNQDLTTGSILIEVGSHGNTIDQAVYAGELIGKSLAVTLSAIADNVN
jgi:stage II sporulation protein P